MDMGGAATCNRWDSRRWPRPGSGFAWSQGYADGAVPREQMLAHLRQIVDSTDVPVNADFGAGFAHTPEELAESVRLAVETGMAGLSIEDSTAVRRRPLYDLPTAVLRMRAARRAIDRSGGDSLLVGRAECFLVGLTDLEQTIGASRPMPRPGQIACMRPASGPAITSRRWCAPLPPSRSICCLALQAS